MNMAMQLNGLQKSFNMQLQFNLRMKENIRMKRILKAIILLLTSLHLAAEENLTLDTIDVYTATPLPSIGLPMDMVPANIQMVNQKELSKQSGVSVADYMANNLQGVTVNEIAGNPFQLEINYHGYNATPIAGNPQGLSVYVDGVRVNEPFSNTVMWDLIPNFAIDRMQMIGGSNPIFGLNTLGGALSMQTKSGRTFNKTAVDYSAGSWGRQTSLLETGGISEDKKFDYYVGYEHFTEDGWRDYSPSHVNQLFAQLGWESETSRYEVNYTGAHNLMIGNGLTPKGLLGNDLEGIHTLEDETKNNFGKLVLTGTDFIDDKTMLSTNAYYIRSDRKTYNGDLNDDFCNAEMAGDLECSTESQAAYGVDATENTNEGVLNRTSTKQASYGANIQATFDHDFFERRNQLVIGSGVEYSLIRFRQSGQEIATLDASGFFSGATEDEEQTTGLTGKTKTFGLFATNTHSLSDQLSINTAARYNFIQVDNSDTFNAPGGDSLTGKHHFERINPSVGITFHPTKDYTTYASYSESSRAPTSIELGCANPDRPCNLPTQMADDPPLEQVVAKTFEVGARGKISRNVNWNAAIYDATNHDDILFVNSSSISGLGYFTNVSKTTRQGVDLGMSFNADKLSMNVNYGYVLARYGSDIDLPNEVNTSNVGSVISVKKDDYLPNIPKHHLKIRTEYQFNPEFSLGATLSAFTKSYMMGNENQGHDSSGGLQGEIPGYAILNLDSEYNFFKGWKLYAKAINVLDQRYYTGGRLAESQVDPVTRLHSGDEALGVASLLPGSPQAAWIGLRHEF